MLTLHASNVTVQTRHQKGKLIRVRVVGILCMSVYVIRWIRLRVNDQQRDNLYTQHSEHFLYTDLANDMMNEILKIYNTQSGCFLSSTKIGEQWAQTHNDRIKTMYPVTKTL